MGQSDPGYTDIPFLQPFGMVLCVPNLSSSFLLCAQKIFIFKKYGNIATVPQRV